MITGPSLCCGTGPPLPPRRGAGRRLRPGGRVAMAEPEWLVSLLRRSPTPVSLASTPRPPHTLSPLPAATSLRPYVTSGLRSYAKPPVGSPIRCRRGARHPCGHAPRRRHTRLRHHRAAMLARCHRPSATPHHRRGAPCRTRRGLNTVRRAGAPLSTAPHDCPHIPLPRGRGGAPAS